MKAALKIVGWIALGLAGIFIWFAFPEVQPIVGAGLLAVFVYHVISTIVRETVRGELADLRRESKLHTARLEDIDRKVSATLRDALERRRSGI
jgi:hypothetical protein